MTHAAQIFALVASIPALVMIISMVRRGSLRVKYGLMWVPVAGAMIVFSAFPSLLDSLAGALGVAYPPTVVFVLAIALLIFVTVHHSWELSRLDERVRSLAERIAIDRVEQQDSVERLEHRTDDIADAAELAMHDVREPVV